jgi:hypothetical protein
VCGVRFVGSLDSPHTPLTHPQAQASKLGARNKALIPTDARIMCTLRNLNFLLAYWLDFEPPQGGLEDYGFRTDEEGVLVWDD